MALIDQIEASYSDYLESGRAWSPNWHGEFRSQHWSVVLLPPGVTQIETADEYLAFLAKRVEWQILDWTDRYYDEMGLSDDSTQAERLAATYEMIRRYAPDIQFRDTLSPLAVAQTLVSSANPVLRNNLFPYGQSFPVVESDLESADRSADLAYGIRRDITFEGWLTEVFR